MLRMLHVERHVYLFKFLLYFKLCMMVNWEEIWLIMLLNCSKWFFVISEGYPLDIRNPMGMNMDINF
jgi:predicted membrane chloride channel (bestrophin family)